MILEESLLGEDTVQRMNAIISVANDLKDGEVFSDDDVDTLKEFWNMLIEPLNKFVNAVGEKTKYIRLIKKKWTKNFNKDLHAFNIEMLSILSKTTKQTTSSYY